jgi:hypothetical protein
MPLGRDQSADAGLDAYRDDERTCYSGAVVTPLQIGWEVGLAPPGTRLLGFLTLLLVSVRLRIPTKPDSDSDRCRTAIRRKPDSDPKEAGHELDEAGHYRPSTAH